MLHATVLDFHLCFFQPLVCDVHQSARSFELRFHQFEPRQVFHVFKLFLKVNRIRSGKRRERVSASRQTEKGRERKKKKKRERSPKVSLLSFCTHTSRRMVFCLPSQ